MAIVQLAVPRALVTPEQVCADPPVPRVKPTVRPTTAGPSPPWLIAVAETHLGTEQLMDTEEPPMMAWAVTVAEPLPGSRVKTN